MKREANRPSRDLKRDLQDQLADGERMQHTERTRRAVEEKTILLDAYKA